MKNLYFILCFCCIAMQMTYAQTTFIKDIPRDNFDDLSGAVYYNGKLYFTAYQTDFGRELWCTDGTPLGTYMVKDINPGSGSGTSLSFDISTAVHKGILYFSANDGVTGKELWRTDGTAAGTFLVIDLSAGSAGNVGAFTSVGNNLFFISNNSLYKTNGNVNNVTFLKNFNVLGNLYGFNGLLYFSADNNNQGQELWVSNGTPNGTYLLKDLNGVLGASLPCNFNATANTLFFMSTGNGDWELWKTDGTSSGTVLVKDINPNGNSVANVYSTVKTYIVNNEIYFKANDGVSDFQLWKSDGTANGTVKISNLPNGIHDEIAVSNGKIYFGAYNDAYFSVYDVANNTVSTSNYPKFTYFNNEKYIFINDDMFYAGKDTILGMEIWKADGTTAGIAPLQELHLVNALPSNPNTQGYNNIMGILGDTLILQLAKAPYSYDFPLFAYNAADTTTAYYPSVVVPVALAPTTAHFLWNTVKNSSMYEFRYRLVGNNVWTTLQIDKTYLELPNLQINSSYQYQIKANCNGIWSNWSPTNTYNTNFTNTLNALGIIAEKQEDSTTQRIYWIYSPSVELLQIRYRPYMSATWTTVNDDDGYKKLTGLLPNTFYEYQYRAKTNGNWNNWTSNFYFNTAAHQPNVPIITSDSVNVTFRVNMENETVTGIVYLEGSFNNFATSFAMTDADNDNLWETTLRLPDSSNYMFRFINDTNAEQFDASYPCAMTLTNTWYRALIIHDTDTTLTNFCFNKCHECPIHTDPQLNTTANIEIYPNPVNTTIYFKNVPQNFEYFLITTTGQVIKQGKNETTLNLSELKTGIYTIILRSDNQTIHTQTILKE